MANFDGELLSRTFRGVPYCFCRTCCMFGGLPRELPSFIRQVGGKLWKPFAILPNIEGQKFTIGETFSSREEHGEFIFWKRPMKEKLNITTGGNLPVCEITCAEDKYWVAPLLSGGEVVAVNDVEIQDRTELKFGDYLSLGVPATPEELENWKHSFPPFIRFPDNEDEMPGWAKLELDAFESTHRLVLLFQRREYDFDSFWRRELEQRKEEKKTSKNETDVDLNLEHVEKKKETGFSPPLDDLVVSLILSYLPFDDVKNVRFLSKVWNREALRLMKKKGLVKFDFSLGYKKLDDSTKLFRYNHEMQENPIPHWRIAIPCIGLNEYVHEIRPAQGEKVIADFHRFLGLKTHNVTSLDFGGKIASKFDYDEQIRILEMCPIQTIQNFELGWTWIQDEASGQGYRFPSRIKFTNLETFVLSMDVGHYDIEGDGGPSRDCSSLTPWFSPFLHAVKGVRVLILKCTFSALLETFYDLAKPFRNLEEITIQRNITPKGLKFLNKLKKPLTKMNIGRFEHWKKPQYLGFGRLLRKHSQTLTSLKITLGNCVKSNTNLNLPSFPSLKELHVAKDSWSDQDETFPLKVSFDGDDGISYAKHFSSLVSLKLGEDNRGFLVRSNENENDDLYHTFLPLGDGEDGNTGFQVCKTLRRLDLPTKATLESGSLFARAGEIARMFPNVHNPWIDKARESSENPTEQVSSN
ncbi:uncharacterized protein LOC118433957 [Folsomia candida]|uniref:F-box domain-containing protein n=1 Tax=Folsomia candida TaxID=158441 RepID=A0A226EW60_FOLCA|nr:uncharacterized protein LOC118433957 [Folsomia candida]OXA61759.1 hypothetical protein Fcan01_00412 [Folsomia candida]